MKRTDTNRKFLKLLFRSLDGELKAKDQKKLDEELKKTEDLRKEKEKILEQRQAVTDSAGRSFDPHFAERVMNRIEGLGRRKNGLEAFYDSFVATFRKVAIVSAAVLVLLISYNMIKSDILPEEELFFLADTAMEEILNLPLF